MTEDCQVMLTYTVRLAGGPLVVALQKDPTNVGLAIAAIICLNVGVVPLVIAASGFLRIV